MNRATKRAILGSLGIAFIPVLLGVQILLHFFVFRGQAPVALSVVSSLAIVGIPFGVITLWVLSKTNPMRFILWSYELKLAGKVIGGLLGGILVIVLAIKFLSPLIAALLAILGVLIFIAVILYNRFG